MAKKKEPIRVVQDPVVDMEQVKRRLDMFDQRLDNIDSMITAVVERVMSQPISLNITCPNCSKNIEIALIAVEKPTR